MNKILNYSIIMNNTYTRSVFHRYINDLPTIHENSIYCDSDSEYYDDNCSDNGDSYYDECDSDCDDEDCVYKMKAEYNKMEYCTNNSNHKSIIKIMKRRC